MPVTVFMQDNPSPWFTKPAEFVLFVRFGVAARIGPSVIAARITDGTDAVLAFIVFRVFGKRIDANAAVFAGYDATPLPWIAFFTVTAR
jgi:hypothetical protein